MDTFSTPSHRLLGGSSFITSTVKILQTNYSNNLFWGGTSLYIKSTMTGQTYYKLHQGWFLCKRKCGYFTPPPNPRFLLYVLRYYFLYSIIITFGKFL